MAAPPPIKVGTRVEVVGKDVIGTVAYIGTTVFSSGEHSSRLYHNSFNDVFFKNFLSFHSES